MPPPAKVLKVAVLLTLRLIVWLKGVEVESAGVGGGETGGAALTVRVAAPLVTEAGTPALSVTITR